MRSLPKRFESLRARVSDPHFFADPDPGKNLHGDPDLDPVFFFSFQGFSDLREVFGWHYSCGLLNTLSKDI